MHLDLSQRGAKHRTMFGFGKKQRVSNRYEPGVKEAHDPTPIIGTWLTNAAGEKVYHRFDEPTTSAWRAIELRHRAQSQLTQPQ